MANEVKRHVVLGQVLTSDPEPPLFIFATDGLDVYQSVKDAVSSVEHYDVLDNEYFGFDSRGFALAFYVRGSEVLIARDLDVSPQPERLMQCVADDLRRTRFAEQAARLEGDDLLCYAIALFGHEPIMPLWQRLKDWWNRVRVKR